MSENLRSGPDPFIEDQQAGLVVDATAMEVNTAVQSVDSSPFAAPDASQLFGTDHEVATKVAAEAAALTAEAIDDEGITPTPSTRKEFILNAKDEATGNQIISRTKIKQARDNVAERTANTSNLPQIVNDETDHIYSRAVELAQSQIAQPEQESDINPWEKVPGAEVSMVLEGRFLGNKKLLGENNNGYEDEYYQPVVEAGIAFGVEQASYGYTGISAMPLSKEVKVEALQEDAENKSLSWVGTDDRGHVIVTDDWGKMGKLPTNEWANNNLGKEGGRAGIIRVTDKNGNQRFYVMGADFQGEPDNWRVTGQIVEVYPKNAPALMGEKLGLPSAEESLATREKLGLNRTQIEETALKKAQRLYNNQYNKGDYSYMISGDAETDAAINALSPKEREQYEQWKIERASKPGK